MQSKSHTANLSGSSPSPLAYNSWHDGKWSSAHETASQPPMAWAMLRHQTDNSLTDERAFAYPTAPEQSDKDKLIEAPPKAANRCTHAVVIACLHLSHELNLRTVGLYGWHQPSAKDPVASMRKIMTNICGQFKSLCQRRHLECKLLPDPSRPVIQATLAKARHSAGNAYMAVYYSGHGIQEPPTQAGELWCYDVTFEDCIAQRTAPSEYIPILLFDMITWAGAATVWVWDCKNAGRIVRQAAVETAEIDRQLVVAGRADPAVAKAHPAVYSQLGIHFAACGADEELPTIEGLPDDCFTACMTTPLRLALQFWMLQDAPGVRKRRKISVETWNRIPGDTADKESALGKLDWVFSTIVDTIAWQTLDLATFKMLFRQDSVILGLSRGFILAQRVMQTYGCTPVSQPHFKGTHSHSLWATWDLYLDVFFAQLPDLDHDTDEEIEAWAVTYKPLPIFSTHLEAIAGVTKTLEAALPRLPIVLQAVLDKKHQLEACKTLAGLLKTADVDKIRLCLDCGLAQLRSRMLNYQSNDLVTAVVSIWASLSRDADSARALALTEQYTVDNVAQPNISFFLDMLKTYHAAPNKAQSTVSVEQAGDCLFVIAACARQSPTGKAVCLAYAVDVVAADLLKSKHFVLQRWAALTMAALWDGQNPAVQSDLIDILHHMQVEVRATTVYALSQSVRAKLLQRTSMLEGFQLANKIAHAATSDASPTVRRELAFAVIHCLNRAPAMSAVAAWMASMSASRVLGSADETGLHYVVQAIRAATSKLSKDDALQKALLLQELDHLLLTAIKLAEDPSRPISREAAKCLETIATNLHALRLKYSTRWFKIIRNLGLSAPFQGDNRPPQFEDVPMLKQVLVDEDPNVLLQRDPSTPMLSPVDPEEMADFARLTRGHQESGMTSGRAMEAIAAKSSKASPNNSFWLARHREMEDGIKLSEQLFDLPWLRDIDTLKNPYGWDRVMFHCFDPILSVCNNTNAVRLWNWDIKQETHVAKMTQKDLKISGAWFINELYPGTVFYTEATNGAVHVYSNYGDDDELRVAACFQALPKRTRTIPMVSTWYRHEGRLTVAGDSPVINIWDAPSERLYNSFETKTTAAVTTMWHEPVCGNLRAVGFDDGCAKLYDARKPAKAANVINWDAHCKSLLKVGICTGESRYVSTAGRDGTVKIWDIRSTKQCVVGNAVHAGGSEGATFQPHNGAMALVSKAHTHSHGTNLNFQVLGVHSGKVQSITNEDVFIDPGHLMRSRPGIVLHPFRMVMALTYGESCHLRGIGPGKGNGPGGLEELRKT